MKLPVGHYKLMFLIRDEAVGHAATAYNDARDKGDDTQVNFYRDILDDLTKIEARLREIAKENVL